MFYIISIFIRVRRSMQFVQIQNLNLPCRLFKHTQTNFYFVLLLSDDLACLIKPMKAFLLL